MPDTTAPATRELTYAEAIREALDWPRYQGTDRANKLMPPADSLQHEHLQAALAQNPKLLDEMRAVVPALFDF